MEDPEFGKRFKQAFGDAKNYLIARKLGSSDSAVKNYVDGRVPPAEMLLRIRELTYCNLDWLLTGEGSQFVGGERVFNIERSIELHDDWRAVIDDWYEFEGRPMPMPETMGASFMGGWNSFDKNQKIAALTDFKNFLDLTFGEKNR